MSDSKLPGKGPKCRGRKDAQERLPPLRWIAAALRTTTETLAHELANPSTTPPVWGEAEWRVAQAAAAIHGISPLLANRLRWRGPPFWNDFLEQQREHTRRRQVRIAELLRRIDDSARERGLAVVALKGAALHERGYCYADERPMSDIDLLVQPHDRASAASMIEALGYRFSYEIWKHAVFVPSSGRAAACIGEHADNPIKIELHAALVERMPRERFDITTLIAPSLQTAGLNCYPRPAVMMAHVLLHAAGAIVWRALRALQLHDIATIAKRMDATDWWEFTSIQCNRRCWWAYPPLALTASYFPGSIPGVALHTAKSLCPMTLRAALARRTLADVSVSEPYVRAFAGIEWNRSPTDLMHYLYERVRPSAQTLALRERYDEYQSLGEDMPWVRQSQLERIVRFLVSHPPRVETIATVRAALLGS